MIAVADRLYTIPVTCLHARSGESEAGAAGWIRTDTPHRLGRTVGGPD